MNINKNKQNKQQANWGSWQTPGSWALAFAPPCVRAHDSRCLLVQLAARTER
jgi:hypothetical protein